MGRALFEGIRARSSRLCATLATTAASVWLLAGGAPALAAEAHPLLASFGSFANPNGIAVDEASGDVYVADLGTETVYKFDANGNPAEFTSLGGNALSGSATPAGSFSFPSEAGTPAAVAFDNACAQHKPALGGPACVAFDPSAGDLYVMDAGHSAIDKFDASGAYIGQIGAPLAGQTLYGLGVEANGDLRVFMKKDSDSPVDVFDNSPVNIFVKSLAYVKEGITGFLEGTEDGFAVAPAGDMYMLGTCGCLAKRGGNMEPLGRVDSGSADVAAAVDPATGHVYVDEQSYVEERDTGGMNGDFHGNPTNSFDISPTSASISSFGIGQLSPSSQQGGVAVNGSTGAIYVSNPADGRIYVFGSDAPGVSVTKPASVSKTAATLQGAINPRGAVLASCQFEYEVAPTDLEEPVATYGQRVACDQTPDQVGAGDAPVPVSATIGGLAPGRLYHFRLVAEGADGTSSSSGLVATSGPGFGIKNFDISFLNNDGTPDTQAGSHPYRMVTDIAINTKVIQREKTADSRYVTMPDGYVRDILVDLPPGLVGDPNATAKKCKVEELEPEKAFVREFGGGRCPPESQVGELEVEFGEGAFSTFREPVYNMVPPPGVAAQLGANFIVPDVFVNVGVLAGGDYPVQASSTGISQIEPLIATRLTVFGIVGSGESRKAFLTLPTGCTGPLRSSVSADSYQDMGRFVGRGALTRDSAGQPLALSGCSKLLFPPTITVTPDGTNASTSSGLTVGVHVSQKGALNPDGLAESSLRDTTVTLPEGVALNPAGADGLESCSEGLAGFTGFGELNAEFEPGVETATFTSDMPSPLRPGVNFCPSGSKIGTVQITSPLLQNPLEGAVYLASQGANPFASLVAMYMFAEDPVSGTVLKLAGEVRLSDTGQIVTTFKNTPDLPFEDLEIHFFGGERAPLSTPSRCGTYTTEAVFTPWDGNGPVTSTSSFTIDHGPGGGPCPGASLPFSPSLTAGTTSIQAGGFSPFTMTMSREDGQQNLQAISLKMPPGLSGLLTGIELCGEAQANAGTCGPNSLIGETIVSVGVGNDPFTVRGGKVYLTGPYRGAPFGLSIVNPAKAGPYDLGQVIVRAKVEVDPITADLTITSDNEGPYKIPTIIDGIPLQIKHVNVTITRPSFTFNPTNCDKLAIDGVLHSTEGAASSISVPFQATNCARLSFKPRFEVFTSGRTSRATGASLHVKLTYPKLPFGTQANIRSVKVDLPRQLPSRLETLKQACIDSVFAQNPAACPAASKVGIAKATTPLVPVPLTGPAYFVSHGGQKFPELIVVLQGYGVTVDLHSETFIDKHGITSSTFRTIPDVPVGTFELTLPEGPYSALAANRSLCDVARTIVKRKRVHVKVQGRRRIRVKTIRKRIVAGLVMPTKFAAQNGMVIRRSTPIAVTGCAKRKHHKHEKK